MRRSPLVLAATVAGTAGVIAFHAHTPAVSGATFTSASYTQSLQAALDKLGFKAPDGSRAGLQVP